MPNDEVDIPLHPVLAVGLGRGGTGKSTLLAEAVWRAQSQGRDVIVADGDPRSETLSKLFANAMRPLSEELPDIKSFLTTLLNRMVKERRSAVSNSHYESLRYG
jgi:MinD-like ATPase involved in chromosome partitioning or flagellar assembly